MEGGRKEAARKTPDTPPPLYKQKHNHLLTPPHTRTHAHTRSYSHVEDRKKKEEKKKVDSLSLLQLNPVKEKMMRDRKQEKKSHLKLYVFGGKKCAYIKEVNV